MKTIHLYAIQSRAESALVKRAASYINKMPRAIAGEGGHAATFSVTCRLVELGLTFDEAWLLLADWNQTRALPPWTDKELHHKLTDAFKHTSPKGNFAPLQSPSPFQDRRSNRIVERRFTPPAPNSSKNTSARANDDIATTLREGTETELNTLAALRGISLAGVKLASERGLLRFAKHRWQRAWYILDNSRHVIQARRLDGQKWTPGAKAWTLQGSKAAWPVGINEAQNFPTIALCEGGPDLLAACHFIATQGRAADCAPVAMLSATYNISSEALALFSGKQIRIYAHDDERGCLAASRWKRQLEMVDVNADVFSFAGRHTTEGTPIKDLNDLARAQSKNEHLLKNLLP